MVTLLAISSSASGAKKYYKSGHCTTSPGAVTSRQIGKLRAVSKMQLSTRSSVVAYPSIGAVASCWGGQHYSNDQYRLYCGSSLVNSNCMLGLGSSKIFPGRGVGVQLLANPQILRNRGSRSGTFQSAPPQVLRRKRARLTEKWKAPRASRLDEDPDWERKSSNGSASSSSNGSAAKSVTQEPKPFVARDGTPKPGIVVVSSPGDRLSPQDSGFASQLSDTRPNNLSKETEYKQPTSTENGKSASSAESRNGIGGIPFASVAISEQITDAPSCPMPNFATTATRVTLLQPVPLLPSSAQKPGVNKRPLLIYVPGMDGTGQGIRPQIEGLYTDG